METSLPGLTVWAVLVPEALAYATIAGVPGWSVSTRRRRR
jgi:MFS superfamily sulfate permease-like transporter